MKLSKPGGHGIPSYSVLGSQLHLFTIDSINTLVDRSIDTGKQSVVLSKNLHSLYLELSSGEIDKGWYEQSFVRIDGMALVAICKLSGVQAKRENRLTWLDWYPALFGLAEERGWRILWMGGNSSEHRAAQNKLSRLFPDLGITFTSGFFDHSPDSLEFADKQKQINSSPHDILMVGLGMPLQEQWIANNRNMLDSKVILSCGGFIDYFSEAKLVAPRWLGQIGLEWAYRLLTNPTRMWRRYLIEPAFLTPIILNEVLFSGRNNPDQN